MGRKMHRKVTQRLKKPDHEKQSKRGLKALLRRSLRLFSSMEISSSWRRERLSSDAAFIDAADRLGCFSVTKAMTMLAMMIVVADYVEIFDVRSMIMKDGGR